ncbi:hypothetical protein XENOCAPTIV_003951 [Xenoophorus captivus]|uniref:Uncharacterized protein n=1 Tax=Xenoophorus captivus TaxID=1517983 RepID=A0ABV0RNX1_9TELE
MHKVKPSHAAGWVADECRSCSRRSEADENCLFSLDKNLVLNQVSVYTHTLRRKGGHETLGPFCVLLPSPYVPGVGVSPAAACRRGSAAMKTKFGVFLKPQISLPVL